MPKAAGSPARVLQRGLRQARGLGNLLQDRRHAGVLLDRHVADLFRAVADEDGGGVQGGHLQAQVVLPGVDFPVFRFHHLDRLEEELVAGDDVVRDQGTADLLGAPAGLDLEADGCPARRGEILRVQLVHDALQDDHDAENHGAEAQQHGCHHRVAATAAALALRKIRRGRATQEQALAPASRGGNVVFRVFMFVGFGEVLVALVVVVVRVVAGHGLVGRTVGDGRRCFGIGPGPGGGRKTCIVAVEVLHGACSGLNRVPFGNLGLGGRGIGEPGLRGRGLEQPVRLPARTPAGSRCSWLDSALPGRGVPSPAWPGCERMSLKLMAACSRASQRCPAGSVAGAAAGVAEGMAGGAGATGSAGASARAFGGETGGAASWAWSKGVPASAGVSGAWPPAAAGMSAEGVK